MNLLFVCMGNICRSPAAEGVMRDKLKQTGLDQGMTLDSAGTIGFRASFYEAYDAAFPRTDGWRERRELYNLYQALNHFNLFGGHDGRQAQEMIETLSRVL